jgi:hypothetical protein
MSAGRASGSSRVHRRSLWEYDDRRVSERLAGIAHAYAYWTGLGVEVSVEEIAAEAGQLERCLRELPPARFVDVGAGPGASLGCCQVPDLPSIRANAPFKP